MHRYLVPSLAILFATPLSAAAAESDPAGEETLTVTATRLADRPFEQPYALYRHDRLKLDQNVGRTALDRINYGPGVFMQSTAPNQISPFIRGLTGEQTALMIDGVRLSHATMRPGPNQYAALVPDMSIARIDAILGSSAAATGSDGLTGVLDMRLADAGRGVGKALSPWGRARVDHANGSQLQAGLDGELETISYSIEGSAEHYHDRIGGKDAEEHLFDDERGDHSIPNTNYDQYSLAGRVAWQVAEEQELALKLGYTQQDDAPRPDGYFANSGSSSRISRFFDPHEFIYLHLHHTWQPDDIEWLQQLRSTLWWHENDEHQVRERVRGPGYRLEVKDDKTTGIGLDVEATSFIGESHSLTYGINASFESTANGYQRFEGVTADDAVLVGEDVASTRTTIPDDSSYDMLAVFAQDVWAIDEEWELLIGLRLSNYSWEADVTDRSGFDDVDTVDDSVSDLSGGLRASWFFHEQMMAFAGVGKAFRAPNLTNLTGTVDRGSDDIPVRGNPSLEQEVSYTIEAGWKYEHEQDHAMLTVFHTTIDDLIQPVYADINDDGIIDENDEATMENSEGAELSGFEVDVDYGLPDEWIGDTGRLAVLFTTSLVDATIDLTQLDGTVEEDNLSRANRLYGILGLHYDHEAGWWTRAQVRWHDTYDDVAESDAGDVRLTVAGKKGTDDGSMPGYGVIDLSAGWRSEDGNRDVTVHIENLANKTYREPGSGADSPGLNVGLTGGVRF